MPIIAKFESSFIPAPSGLHRAVCVDVIDLGIVKRVYNGEMSMPHMIKLVWQIEPTMDDGSHFIITKDYTLALSPRANLYRDLTSWRKKEFTDDELKGFDVEKIVGAPCLINVVEKRSQKTGNLYTKVDSVLPMQSGQAPLSADGKYTRVIERDRQEQDNYVSNARARYQKQFEEASQQYAPEKTETGGRPDTSSTNDFDDDLPF